MEEYEELLKYNIYDAIKSKSGGFGKTPCTVEEIYEYFNKNPLYQKNNPLLTNYNWVYEHVEDIFINGLFAYQQYQGVDEYYIFFKACINKYRLNDDYEKILSGEFFYKNKWRLFAVEFVKFFGYCFDERLILLLKREDFAKYFLKYIALYEQSVLEDFGSVGMSELLKYEEVANSYVENPRKLISLVRKYPRIELPISLSTNSKIIKHIARTVDVEQFYQDLYFLSDYVGEMLYIDEHIRFCDEQIKNISDGLLPCLRNAYENFGRLDVIKDNIPYFMESKVIWQFAERIFEKTGLEKIPKDIFFTELSKYIIVWMFISRYFETSPYNLLIDIKTLYEFAREHYIKLNGDIVYEFLFAYENMSLEQIIDFYQNMKEVPIKEILYDDWENTKKRFILELNANMLNLDEITLNINSNGVEYYDITDNDRVLLVRIDYYYDYHETIDVLINQIKVGSISSVSLSVQDKNHYSFYRKENGNSIKFIYGPLNPKKVGTIYHEDAYTQGLTQIEHENILFHGYRRRLYTLDKLMAETNPCGYNEIKYSVNGDVFMPLGVLCDNEISDIEIKVAKELGIKIFYRKTKEVPPYTKISEAPKVKTYKWHLKDMRIF